MDDEHFGNCLRRAREERASHGRRRLCIDEGSALGARAARIGIARSVLPAHVFVRGFIRSYAKAVGIDRGAAARPVRSRRQREERGGARRSRRARSSIRASPAASADEDETRPSPRARPGGVRDHPRADRDDHAVAAAAPPAAVGRGALAWRAAGRRRRCARSAPHDRRDAVASIATRRRSTAG